MKTLACIESFTGGYCAHQITIIPGASKIFRGALVAYSNDIKAKLGVSVENGVINAEAAKEMALKGKEFFGVDYCLAFTGNAGPTANENMPAGVVFIALNDKVYEKHYSGSREQVIKSATIFALNLPKVKKCLLQISSNKS